MLEVSAMKVMETLWNLQVSYKQSDCSVMSIALSSELKSNSYWCEKCDVGLRMIMFFMCIMAVTWICEDSPLV
jgi:hypothetical protein